MPENLFSTEDVFLIGNDADFNAMALRVFHFQYRNNAVYRKFCDLLETKGEAVRHYRMIPCLPVDTYRKNEVGILNARTELVFETSGTTGKNAGKHRIPLASDYMKAIAHSFTFFFGDPAQYCFLFLLPSYMERPNSSLVWMAEYLAKQAPDSGFYLYNHGELYQKLFECREKGRKTILLGVTFALLDFAIQYKLCFPDLKILETGGMKGRREEMGRESVHEILKNAFGVKKIGSEYGMTELLSQAYSAGDGIFEAPPWMKILPKDFRSPLHNIDLGRTGKLAVMDLAAANSCPFIQTDDLGRAMADGTFTVAGRSDFSVIRGCNMLV